ncbi:Benzoylformate decarboxylase [compost metagenome]
MVFIILKNGTYGALRWFADVLDVSDAPGLDVPGLDFCAIAQGYGVQAVQAATAEAFASAFSEALAGNRPVLIEVPTQTIEP